MGFNSGFKGLSKEAIKLSYAYIACLPACLPACLVSYEEFSTHVI